MVTDPSLGIKHALVTGATGIVGVPLCLRLLESGASVAGFSRRPGVNGLNRHVTSVQGDILSLDDLECAAEGADVIFHAAAAVHGSAKDSAEFERMNVGGTVNVISVARKTGAKLIHVSSVNVVGHRSGDLRDAYAASKSRAEDLVIAAASSGIDAVVVRPATVFGNEVGRAGLLVDRVLSGSLRILPAPSRKISPVWSGDLANALIGAARVGESGSVHTVAGPTISTGEFVKQVCASSKRTRPMLSIPGWAVAMPLQLAWWTKKLTRWTPPVTVESLLNGSMHSGIDAAQELGFEYSAIEDIFGRPTH